MCAYLRCQRCMVWYQGSRVWVSSLQQLRTSKRQIDARFHLCHFRELSFLWIVPSRIRYRISFETNKGALILICLPVNWTGETILTAYSVRTIGLIEYHNSEAFYFFVNAWEKVSAKQNFNSNDTDIFVNGSYKLRRGHWLANPLSITFS
jgi:uncharacterized membrane protein